MRMISPIHPCQDCGTDTINGASNPGEVWGHGTGANRWRLLHGLRRGGEGRQSSTEAQRRHGRHVTQGDAEARRCRPCPRNVQHRVQGQHVRDGGSVHQVEPGATEHVADQDRSAERGPEDLQADRQPQLLEDAVRTESVRALLVNTVVCSVAMLALAGCNPGSSKNPGESPSTTPSASSVSNPLSADKLAADPCTGLTDAELATYSGQIRQRVNQSDDDVKACLFRAVDGNKLNASVEVYPKTPGATGIEAAAGNFPYFKKIDPIDGYPAYNRAGTSTVAGTCTSIVAVNDKSAVAVAASSTSGSEYYSKPCTVSDALVKLVIAKLKAGG
ncbi:DUF3558 domain-containing protein [Pseudonocardiaceae bacterium YIM PH 21723]|nr:DUF3558 domain-containing protein [Pseudonocardiaceae bacterium YIM PH 21723]